MTALSGVLLADVRPQRVGVLAPGTSVQQDDRVVGAELAAVGQLEGAAASGAFELADRGAFDPDDTVVLLNTGAGSKDADALRAHVGEQNAG